MERRSHFGIGLSLVICLLFVANSCIDVIDLNVDETTEILIIDASIYNDGSTPIVNIRKSAAFASGPSGVQLPVTNAQVEIVEMGGLTLQLDESESGIYTSDLSIGSSGKEYQLKVNVNGNSYESLIEKMPETIPIKELNWDTKEELVENIIGSIETQRIIQLKTNADLEDSPNPVFLRYRIEGTWELRERTATNNLFAIFCWISQRVDLNNLALVDGRQINNGQLLDQIILEEVIDYRFAYNYCFTVIQQSISNSAFNYWNSIQNEFERTGDIFEAPPSRIKGNISNINKTENDVIGIFSAIAPSVAKINVSGLLIVPVPLDRCQGFAANIPASCFACETLANSTTINPGCQ